jgi:hypothetical protein
MKTGIELIADERKEQIEKHRYTIEHDRLNNSQQELSHAARALLRDKVRLNSSFDDGYPFAWRDNYKAWAKMAFKPYKERLIIAGALIAAELDRLQFEGE